jgi:hypothetical protein
MIIQIRHQTRYDYNSEVVLGIHKLYLIPQYRPYFRIEHQKFLVTPEPEGNNFRQDLAGNWYRQCWFTGRTSSMEITGEWIFKLHQFNPFGFIIDKDFAEKGWSNPLFQFGYQEKTDFLIPFRATKPKRPFRDFLLEIKDRSQGLVDFLVHLTSEIHGNWNHLVRYEQNIWPVDLTFTERRGSCRDLSVMQMEMLREIGLATRFVSGYAFNSELNVDHELHAWLEVYLPGAGWIGLDPSLGLLTDHRYIPLAFHPDPARTSPVQGSFAGGAESALTTLVEMKLLHQGK